MTLWGCRLGSVFADCASTSYTFPHIIIVVVVAGVMFSVALYYGVRLLIWLLRL
jgi:hypothetical protein